MKYRYSVDRSVRKSISVVISTDNKITVRCPWGMSGAEIEKFLETKSGWIEKVVLKNAEKLALNDDIITREKIYLNGKKFRLEICGRDEITEDTVYIKSEKHIQSLYIKQCGEEFFSRVREYAEKAVLYPAEISLKDYKGRWGCCDAKNNLIFNYKLFMLPRGLQDYIIVHELCHTICHDHSKAFWKLVSECMPDYKLRKSELKNYDFLTTLY